MDAARAAEEAERLDALRRRLYSPDATPEDRAAYEAATATAAVRSPSTVKPVPRRVGGGILAAAVLLAAAGVAGLLTTHPFAPTASPSATPSATPSVTPAAAPADERILAPADARVAFLLALRSGHAAGLLDYLAAHPTALPGDLRTNSRAASTEYDDLGSSLIALDPSPLAEHGGRVTVILVTDRPTTYTWQAERVAQANDRSGPVIEVAAHGGSTRPGEPVSFTFRYDDAAPKRLALQLEASAHWGAAVVFTD